jgi:hypothetical protein
VGLVNQVLGDVSYASGGGNAGKVQAYMKMRQGDRFTVPDGAQIKLIYFQNGRMETWRGPASFTSGRASNIPISGSVFQVADLPMAVPQKIAKVSELIQMSKLGGIQVRGVRNSFASLDRDEQAEVAAAWETYHKLRQQLPQDDITPEQYLLPVLQGHLLYDDARVVLDTILRKQPANREALELAVWVKERIEASK